MEKFAVDLDKVLDEFEFNEDHAEQIAEMPIVTMVSQNLNQHRVYPTQPSDLQKLGKDYSDNSRSDSNHSFSLDHQTVTKQNLSVDPELSKPTQNSVPQTYVQKRSNESSRAENSYDKKLNQPNIKPSVSNVFSSLNEYINAPGASLAQIEIADIEEFEEPVNIKSLEVGQPGSVNQVPSYQNMFVPVKTEDAKEVQVQEESNSKETKISTDKSGQKHVYENVFVGQDIAEKKHTYENVDFDTRDQIDRDGVYECIYIGTRPDLPETTTELETVAMKMTEQLNAAEGKSKFDDSKLVFQNVQLGAQAQPQTSSTVAFSNIDDLSEEELNKYLAELEAEEMAKENSSMYENVAISAPEPAPFLPNVIKDEDENEAPIFESVMIGELPSVSEEDLQEKAKKFPVIDYSNTSSDEPIEEVSKRKEEPKTVLEAKDETEDRMSKNVTEKVRKSSDSVSVKCEETVEQVKETESSANTEIVPVSNEVEEPIESKSLKEEVEKTEEDEKEVDTEEIKDNKLVKGHSFRPENVLNVNNVEETVNIKENVTEEDRSKSETQGMVNNVEHVEIPEDDRPTRPQTLDIVSTVNMNDNYPVGSPVNVFGVPELAEPELQNEIRAPSPDVSENSSTSGTTLGKQPPFWIPDSDAPNCMLCDMKFTILKRRHHCRACGKVLCGKCCDAKYKLEYQGNVESRVCLPCHQLLTKAESEQGSGEWSSYSGVSGSSNSQVRQPNPNNPMEYCSTIPPLQQLAGGLPPPPPTVMVPVGVLKREGSTKQRSDSQKSVMFSDGIRPGCDLTELDSSWTQKPGMHIRTIPVSRKQPHKRISSPGLSSSSAAKRQHSPPFDPATNSYIPADPGLLPPTVTLLKGQITYHDVVDQATLYASLKNDCEPPVIFAINRNLYACVKLTNLNCCVNRVCWNITSKGLACVGQDEVIFLIETLPDETQVPKDILLHINQIYHEAVKGNTITEYNVSIHQSGNLLGSREHAGFLFIRQTLQCLQKIILPPAPFLVALLVHRWETPWAKVFPLRLVLRLGAEYRYYPCPLVSVRFRDAVYFEIGHTVMKLLADFRNYAYTLPSVRGLTIHMQDRTTIVRFPKNRYDQVIKGLNNSNDHVLAYASNFSVQADSHLVCIQQQTNSEDESSYQTQAINIQNKPRKVTGASFIVINGALKSSMGLTAKSSIVEDGLMVQIMPEKMEALKAALKNMHDFAIGCGKQGATEPDEVVHIKWVENDTMFNLGVKSPIDGKPLDGVPSIRVHNGNDYMGTSRCIRWTEVFIIKSDDHPNGVYDPVDINKLSESIARATCVALVKLLDLLATAGLTKLAVRTTIHPDNVGYEAGSEGTRLPPIYMKSLDNELIQVLQKTVQSSQDTHTVLELVFYVLETENNC